MEIIMFGCTKTVINLLLGFKNECSYYIQHKSINILAFVEK